MDYISLELNLLFSTAVSYSRRGSASGLIGIVMDYGKTIKSIYCIDIIIDG